MKTLQKPTTSVLFLLFFISASVFAQVNLNQGLVAYYPFSGNANDMSTNGNNPSLNTAVLTADRLGNPNSAYRFNGTNSQIVIPNSNSLNSMINQNQISLCAWVRPLGYYTGTCYNNMLLMKGVSDFDQGNYSLRFSDVQFGCSANASTNSEQFFGLHTVIANNPIVQLNQWYSVVCTSDGSWARIYVNCQLRDSVPIGNNTYGGNTDALFLGRLNDPNFSYWLNGDLDEVRIYNRALNQAEVNVYGGCNVSCPADSTITVSKCINQNITLNAGAGSTYSWSPSTWLSSSTIQNPVCFANSNISYDVTITDNSTNCTYHKFINVIVNPAPISNLHDTSICLGDTLQLSAPPATSYSWTPNYNINNTTIANPIVWPAITTSYVVNITNASGCSTKDTVVVTVSNCHCEDSCSWSLTGNLNVLPGNFIGSINNADFKIRTFNQQRMVVKASGNVGIGTQNPSKSLEVNGEARIVTLPTSLINERLVFANASGDLHALATTGNTNQYLSGNGSWQNIPPPGNGTINAQQGLTSAGNVVMLGSDCYTEDGQFINSRKINMNNRNLYFNSYESGKLFMGNTSNTSSEDCMELHTRLEIGSTGLGAANNYDSPNPSTSGLRFTDLTSDTEPIDNETEGVLSLDKDGDVIWVKKCCNTGKDEDRLKDILERLTKLENELKTSKEEAILLKGQLTQMDILLSKNNTIVLNQNIPNPFAENTAITYMIPKTFRQAQIIFTSMNGEVIKIAELKQSGKGQVNVYAKDISSGIYTYTLIVDGKTIDTKKMIKQ